MTTSSNTIACFTLIDQQQDFIVVHKSAGINFHDESELGQGLFNQVKDYAQKTLNIKTLYPVHRLDKMTSGLIIFAKNLAAAQCFQQLFSHHHIEKYYLAVSDKKPRKKQGLIKGDMEKSRRGTWKLMRSQHTPAISQFFSYAIKGEANKGKRLYLIKPHSGKTHQIRVALSSIGAPIIGDPHYHASSKSDRGYLHAYCLRFTFNQQAFEYVLPPNEGKLFDDSAITKLIDSIPHPWTIAWPTV
jgi:tRNA pseudouridine32 synthase/23S rRNA pseudouridine746 synthase